MQNALKWSLSRHADGAEATKDRFVAVESLRSAFDLMHGPWKAFLEEHVRPMDEDGGRDEALRCWLRWAWRCALRISWPT